LLVVLSFAVLQVTSSPARLGLVLASQSAAALLVTLAGDRFPHGRILIASLMARTAVAAAAAAALATGTASFALLLVMAGAQMQAPVSYFRYISGPSNGRGKKDLHWMMCLSGGHERRDAGEV
jgi:hypothetical protein